MAVSKLLAVSGANDFNLNITGATTIANFDKEYASGSYSIVSSGNDATIDIYAYNSAGTQVGYTGTKAFTASGGFNKMVILGGTSGDVLGFTFKKTITTTAATAEVTAGPVAVSVSTASLPNINNTTVLTGNNFASDVTVKFTSANTAYPITSAKSVVRTNSTSLTITRPDNLPTDYSPYSLVLENPGITQPTGSNAHILSNAITSGTAPIWSTAATLPSYTYNTAYSTTVAASDTEASTMSYALNSGVLPTGLSLNSSTGVISGTPTVSVPQTFIVRVTDAGGNFVDRSFTLPNVGPTWVTAASLPNYVNGVYSQTVTATDDVGVTSYSVVAGSTLPTGLSLNTSSGVLSGTITAVTVTNTFTLRATDANGTFSDRAFTILIPYATFVAGLISAGFSVVSGNYERSSSGQITLPAFPSAAVTVDLYGAGGGSGQRDSYGLGGAGGYGRASITAASYGQVMTGFIGGGGGANTGNTGGGGGGGTDLRLGGTAYANRVLVAGGGGGSGAPGGGNSRGGYGGGFNQNGGDGVPGSNGNAQWGLGGTSSAGGGFAGGGSGVNGSFGDGADQGTGSFGFNGGGRGRNTEAGGGGGGWYGGGGSTSGNWGGGGGGGSGYLNSTYFTAGTTTTGGGSAGGSGGSTGTAGKIVIILA